MKFILRMVLRVAIIVTYDGDPEGQREDLYICSSKMPAIPMGRRRTAMPGKERMAELPSSLFILSGTNPFRRVAMRFVRWIVFEWIIILTIIGKEA